MAMTLSQARQFARMSSRNFFDASAYSTQVIDWGFQRAGAEFLREAQSSRTLGTLTLTANSSVLPTMATDWDSSRQLQASLLCAGQLVNPNVEMVDYNTILTAMAETGTTNSQITAQTTAYAQPPYPTMFAFKDSSITSGLVYPPAPGDGYTIEYWYWRTFTSWTPGQAVLTATVGTANNIASVSVVEGGYYPGGAPSLTVSGGSGSGATFTATMVNNVVSSVTVNTQGSNYTSPTMLANGSSAADITFNVSDEALQFIVSDGIQAYVQCIEPQNRQLADDAHARFLKYTKEYAGRNAGGRGGDCWTATPATANTGLTGAFFWNGD